MWLTHGHTAGKWANQDSNLGSVSRVCALNHNTTNVEFNNTVLFLPLFSILSSIVFFYLDGDKKSVSEPELIYDLKKVGQVKQKYLMHNRSGS